MSRRSPSPAPKPIDPSRNPTPTPSPDPSPRASAPTPSPDPTPTSPHAHPDPDPHAHRDRADVDVPSNATKAQIDACVAQAVAAGARQLARLSGRTFAYAGTFIVPDGINLRGQGIWDQGLRGGGGGTWLQCSKGMQWGSDSTIEYLLVGKNTAGLSCTFHPVPRGSSAAGSPHRRLGSHDCTFEFVRFKGGSDDGASLARPGRQLRQRPGYRWTVKSAT